MEKAIKYLESIGIKTFGDFHLSDKTIPELMADFHMDEMSKKMPCDEELNKFIDNLMLILETTNSKEKKQKEIKRLFKVYLQSFLITTKSKEKEDVIKRIYIDAIIDMFEKALKKNTLDYESIESTEYIQGWNACLNKLNSFLSTEVVNKKINHKSYKCPYQDMSCPYVDSLAMVKNKDCKECEYYDSGIRPSKF